MHTDAGTISNSWLAYSTENKTKKQLKIKKDSQCCLSCFLGL